MVDDPAFAGRGYAKIPHAKAANPASLSLGRLAEIGPLRPAPAHSQMSLRDGIDVRLRGGIHRAPDAGGLVYFKYRSIA